MNFWKNAFGSPRGAGVRREAENRRFAAGRQMAARVRIERVKLRGSQEVTINISGH